MLAEKSRVMEVLVVAELDAVIVSVGGGDDGFSHVGGFGVAGVVSAEVEGDLESKGSTGAGIGRCVALDLEVDWIILRIHLI
ncbi:hypothetical protein ACLOJK_007485 [Asimina triloba]